MVASLLGDIWKLSKDSVHTIVLLDGVIQMLVVLLNMIVSNDVFQHLEAPVVLISLRWSIEENSNVGIDHLIVSHEEEGRSIDSPVIASSSRGGGL